ncbi:MAG: hypothetical protein RLZZ385_1654 [Pseudomonadota bacterium]|jgi:hypothetical protein
MKTIPSLVKLFGLSALSAMFALFALFATTGVATAAETYPAVINNEGIGFSRMEDGRVIAYDTVAAYENHEIIVANCDAYKVEHEGISWCFANAENAQMFSTAISEGRSNYIPFGGGHCAMGLAAGNLAARGDPRTAIRIGNALVLNGNFNVRNQFLTDTERNMDNGRLRYSLSLDNGSLVPAQ